MKTPPELDAITAKVLAYNPDAPAGPLKVIAGAPDRPLVIGDIEIDCYVLEDETRVLSRGGFQSALGRHRTSRRHQSSDVVNLPAFLAAGNLKPFVSSNLVTASTPIAFQAPSRGPIAYGYRAELLPQVCEVYLRARDAGELLPAQRHIADRAEILIRGLATIGVIALVDEATGYQRIREERALATILEKFIAKELQPWTQTFPFEFYTEIFRLKGWPGVHAIRRPSVIGKYTNDFVYDRLAPELRRELQRLNPTLPEGGRKHKHHQWFTPEHGHPKLREHLVGVTALMRAAANWSAFRRSMDRAYPKFETTIPFPYDEPNELEN